MMKIRMCHSLIYTISVPTIKEKGENCSFLWIALTIGFTLAQAPAAQVAQMQIRC